MRPSSPASVVAAAIGANSGRGRRGRMGGTERSSVGPQPAPYPTGRDAGATGVWCEGRLGSRLVLSPGEGPYAAPPAHPRSAPTAIAAAILAALACIGCETGSPEIVTPPRAPVLTGAVQRADTGAAVVGAVVILHPSGARAGTDAAGEFSFDSWGVGGATEISAQADGYQTVRQPLDGVSTRVALSLPYLGLGSVAGWVTDQESRPVADVRVEVSGAAVSVTDAASGYYRINRVPAGMQVLLFGSPGYRTLSATVSVRDGRDEVCNVALDRSAHTAAIRGRVFDVGTGAASRPIRGATVSIPDRHTPAMSDQDGNYAVFELDEGWTGVLTVSATGYVTRELHVRDPLPPGYTTVDAPLYAPSP